MKYFKLLILLAIFGTMFSASCDPKSVDTEDRETLKNDSIDMTEGQGEGELGVGHGGGQTM